MDGTILVADDDRTIRTVLTQALTRAGCKVHATGSLQTLMRWVEEGKGDIVISDVIMPDGNGIEILPRIRKLRPTLPVIIISAQNTIMTAVQAAEADAFDYLPKPFDLPDLMKRTAKGLEARRQVFQPKEPLTAAIPQPDTEDLPLIGRSPAMHAVYRLVARLRNADLPVLVFGESGTGKSLIAKAIHDFSARRTGPFFIAESQDLESTRDLDALFERARGGTIVFEEIADYTPEAQALLVRQYDKSMLRAPRYIATSQRDLGALCASGKFRQDLFFRFSSLVVQVPALRDRIEDIPLLAQHFLHRAVKDGHSQRRLTPAAMQVLRNYNWPGNVRQLENVVLGLAILGTETEISKPEVETALNMMARFQSTGFVDPKERGRLSETIAAHLRRYFDLHEGALPPPGLYDRILREVEKPLIEISLDATRGNQLKAADLLGLNRNTLRKKINELDLTVQRRAILS